MDHEYMTFEELRCEMEQALASDEDLQQAISEPLEQESQRLVEELAEAA